MNPHEDYKPFLDYTIFKNKLGGYESKLIGKMAEINAYKNHQSFKS